MLQERKIYFDRTTTNIIKGVALIMMFWHHFFTFPTWWVNGVSYPFLETMAPYFSIPLKMCVPIFCFITGYFYYFNNNKSYKYSLRKITDILISYWGVFILFAILAFLSVGYTYTPSSFIKEMFALTRPTMIFCWYVYFYYTFMLILPLLVKVLSKNKFVDCVICFILIPLIIKKAEGCVSNSTIKEILNSLYIWFPCVLSGYLFACYEWFENILDKINYKLKKRKWLNIIVLVVLIIFVSMCRKYEPTMTITFGKLPIIHKTPIFNINLDIIYAPIFIYSIANLCKYFHNKFLHIILCNIGKRSLLMWFVSCIFYSNSKEVFQPILYLPHDPILVAIWGLILCYLISVMLDFVLKPIQRLKNKLLFS